MKYRYLIKIYEYYLAEIIKLNTSNKIWHDVSTKAEKVTFFRFISSPGKEERSNKFHGYENIC